MTAVLIILALTGCAAVLVPWLMLATGRLKTPGDVTAEILAERLARAQDLSGDAADMLGNGGYPSVPSQPRLAVMTRGDAGELLGKSERTVRRWGATRRLTEVPQPGRQTLVTAASVLAMLNGDKR